MTIRHMNTHQSQRTATHTLVIIYHLVIRWLLTTVLLVSLHLMVTVTIHQNILQVTILSVNLSTLVGTMTHTTRAKTGTGVLHPMLIVTDLILVRQNIHTMILTIMSNQDRITIQIMSITYPVSENGMSESDTSESGTSMTYMIIINICTSLVDMVCLPIAILLVTMIAMRTVQSFNRQLTLLLWVIHVGTVTYHR